MKYSQELIQRIKDRVKVSDILSRQVKLIPAGHMRYKALCPFHNEKTPSFIISDDKQNYHCFGCGAHGDIISFLTEKENYNFADAMQELAQIAGVALPKVQYDEKKLIADDLDYQIINEFQQFFQRNFNGSIAENYIKNRGIIPENIAKFALGYAPKKYLVEKFIKEKGFQISKLLELGLYRKGQNGNYFLFSERLTFPIFNHRAQLVAFGGRILGEGMPKYINSPEYKFFKKRELLYNFYQAKTFIQRSREVILCEGYMDVIAMQQAGFQNVVAPLGTAFSEYHLEALWYFCDDPIICLDGDQAGKKAMLRIADIAVPKLKPGKTLSFVMLPDGQDPDDVIKSKGIKYMQSLLESRIFLAAMLVKEHCHTGLNTPESRSAAHEKLNNIAHKIENESVKAQYLRYFKDAFFKVFRGKSYYIKPKSGNNLAVNTSNIAMEEVELVAFIITNISILTVEQYEEQFAMFDFDDQTVGEIQKHILALAPNFIMADFAQWLGENIAQNFVNYLLNKIRLLSTISLSEYERNKRFDYHVKSIVLGRLRRDYKNNMRSGDEGKQKLAIQLKYDIELLEKELNQHLAG
ncbi:MAG: DNA primase [Alphaproteobacteria bacterium]|jgi:DNA primase|nr:DNA primase [Alphaproteobacteria bacterium]MBT5828454.1 DNA primase [Alphaproteobacteria bacterium]